MIAKYRLLLLAAAAFAARSALASGLPACSLFSGYTLTDMLGQTCFAGDKVFSNFSSTSAPSITNMVTFAALSPVNNDPGIEFNGLTASAGQTVTFNVVYTVQVLPKNAFVIQTGEFSIPVISSWEAGAGISGAQDYCENTTLDAESCVAGGGALYSAPISAAPPSTSFLSATTVPLTLTLDVSTDLTVLGGVSGTEVNRIDERFAQVTTPEPGGFLLLGSGLVVLSGFGRKKLKGTR